MFFNKRPWEKDLDNYCHVLGTAILAESGQSETVIQQFGRSGSFPHFVVEVVGQSPPAWFLESSLGAQLQGTPIASTTYHLYRGHAVRCSGPKYMR